MTISEFIYMGGYGSYVWSAYGLCFMVLIINIIHALLKERKTKRLLQKNIASGNQ